MARPPKPPPFMSNEDSRSQYPEFYKRNSKPKSPQTFLMAESERLEAGGVVTSGDGLLRRAVRMFLRREAPNGRI